MVLRSKLVSVPVRSTRLLVCALIARQIFVMAEQGENAKLAAFKPDGFPRLISRPGPNAADALAKLVTGHSDQLRRYQPERHLATGKLSVKAANATSVHAIERGENNGQ